jgi:hypothetical protein
MSRIAFAATLLSDVLNEGVVVAFINATDGSIEGNINGGNGGSERSHLAQRMRRCEMNTFSLYQRYSPPPFLWVVGSLGVWVVGSFFFRKPFPAHPVAINSGYKRLCVGGRQQHYAAVFQNAQLIRYGGSLSLSQ